MQAVVTFFKTNIGFTDEDMVGVILEFPQVLGYPVKNRLEPFIQYLQDTVGLDAPAIAKLIKQRPVVLGLDRTALEKMVGFLMNSGSSMEEIVTLLETTL